MESLLLSLKDSVNKMESKNLLQNEQQKLKAQFELLEKQLSASQTACSSETEKLHVAEEALKNVSCL